MFDIFLGYHKLSNVLRIKLENDEVYMLFKVIDGVSEFYLEIMDEPLITNGRSLSKTSSRKRLSKAILVINR